MDKTDHDALYHLLRKTPIQCTEEEAGAIRSLCVHLGSGTPNYPGLLNYLQYYGERFLLPKVVDIISKNLPELEKVNRVVDLGAGTGWFGKGIAKELAIPETLLVDKRQWVGIDLIADLEEEIGIQRLLSKLVPTDLVVASELIHCLYNPELLLSSLLKGWPLVFLEYNIDITTLGDSYKDQVAEYGGNPLSPYAVRLLIDSNMDHSLQRCMQFTIDPYILTLVGERRS